MTRAKATKSRSSAGIDRMHKLGTITDAEWAAAMGLQMLGEAAESDGLRGRNYEQVIVDGTFGCSFGMIPGATKARETLCQIRQALGEVQFKALEGAVIEGRSMKALGELWGCKEETAGRRVKLALKNLADLRAARGAGYGIRAERMGGQAA